MSIPDYRLRFQANSPELMRDLCAVLTTDPLPGLMIGFPQVFRDLNGSDTWAAVWSDIRPLVRDDIHYGNTHLSRPIMFEFLGVAWGVELCGGSGRGATWRSSPARVPGSSCCPICSTTSPPPR